MQIHELTQPKLNEGVLDTVKGVASNAVDKGIEAFAGATKSLGTGAIPQTGGVVDTRIFPDAVPFQGQTSAQARANKAQQLNPAAVKKLTDGITEAWDYEVVATEQKLNRPLDDSNYRNLLRKFIDRVFFKGRMSLLNADGLQVVEHAVDTITKFRENPDQIYQTFSDLVKSARQHTPDPKNALNAWKGKVLDVNLQPRNGGVSRAAKFSWDGTHWIDAFTGQPAPEELAKDLTNVAVGTIR